MPKGPNTKNNKSVDNKISDVIFIDLEPQIEIPVLQSTIKKKKFQRKENSKVKSENSEVNCNYLNKNLENRAHSSRTNFINTVNYFDDVTVLHDDFDRNLLSKDIKKELNNIKNDNNSKVKVEDQCYDNNALSSIDNHKNLFSDNLNDSREKLSTTSAQKNSQKRIPAALSRKKKFRYYNIVEGKLNENPQIAKRIKKKKVKVNAGNYDTKWKAFKKSVLKYKVKGTLGSDNLDKKLKRKGRRREKRKMKLNNSVPFGCDELYNNTELSHASNVVKTENVQEFSTQSAQKERKYGYKDASCFQSEINTCRNQVKLENDMDNLNSVKDKDYIGHERDSLNSTSEIANSDNFLKIRHNQQVVQTLVKEEDCNITENRNSRSLQTTRLVKEEDCNITENRNSRSLQTTSVTSYVEEELKNAADNMPSTSTAHCQQFAEQISSKIDKVDFIPRENIKLRDVEYLHPIHPMAVNYRRYYDNKRPMVSTIDADKFVTSGSNCCSFTILNYNVLSQRLLTGHSDLYVNCEEEYLSWGYRWNLLQHEIRSLSPSILTLQEIDETHYTTHFLPWLSYYGYKGVYKKRTGTKDDGCAIFFKSEVFKILEQKSVEFYQPCEFILNRDNIGLIVKLTPKKFHRPFCVSTTHLLYNPKRSDIRLLQMIILLAELDRFCYEGEEGGVVKHCPIILTGDFNTNPNSALLSFLCKSKLRYDNLDAKSLETCYRQQSIGNQLIPSSLGISNYCHHSVLDQGRNLDKIRGSIFSLSDKRKLEESLISIGKSTNLSSNANKYPSNCSSSQGTLYHRFNLAPVYEFNNLSVTTFHRTWTMVDYIFYSQIISKRGTNINDGPLKLLGKYTLPDVQFARDIDSMPCSFCPSDHFPLAAKFLLLNEC